MRYFFASIVMAVLLCASFAHAQETDYLSRMAYESEIKAIAKVISLKRVSASSDGTFYQATFRRIYAVTPYTPKNFVGGSKWVENNWQRKKPGTVYLKPRRGDMVYVTVTSDGGAITSYTPLTDHLNRVVREEPYRITYSHGKAKVQPPEN